MNKKTLWILDGATAHRLEDNPLIQLQKIPSYSPELNPVERFFEELRRRMKFRIFDTLEEAQKCLSDVLEEFFADKERVKSLTLFPYIKYARINLN